MLLERYNVLRLNFESELACEHGSQTLFPAKRVCDWPAGREGAIHKAHAPLSLVGLESVAGILGSLEMSASELKSILLDVDLNGTDIEEAVRSQLRIGRVTPVHL